MSGEAGTSRRPEPGRDARGRTIAQDSGRSRADSVRPLMVLVPLLSRHRGVILAAGLALIVAASATLVVPVALRRVIDSGFTTHSAALVDNYFAVMIAVVAVLAVASSLRYYFVTWLGERIVADLRNQVFAHLLSLSPAFYDQMRTGEVLSRLTADTTQIKSAVGAGVSIALRNAVLLIGAVAMMVVTSPELSGLVLLALPVIVAPLILIGRWVRRLSRHAQDTLADTTALAEENLGGIRTVQAYTQEDAATGRFSAGTEISFEAARSRMRARAMLTTLVIFLVFSSVVLILWWGAAKVLDGEMTGGALGQFVLYAVFAAGAMGELSQVWGELQLAAGAAERLAELLKVEPAIKAPARPRPLPAPRGVVTFDAVHFSYPARPDAPTLNDVSFQVEPGERVAIVGPSGAGKSTVFSLLLRFYDPDAGRILVDGAAIDALDPRALRTRLAIVPQDIVIFAASAADNIRFSRPGASDSEVEDAAREALADGFIRDLPEGYATPLGERGVTISGGQRQRIAIARALLSDAPILLLDEATSALDAQSEQAVQQGLERLMIGRTSLVIAHRLATVLEADRIIVLDHGRVVAVGTHAELVRGGGLYADLARLQFGDTGHGAASETIAAAGE